MDALVEFLTSQEVVTVIMIAIAICVVGTIYFVIERMGEKRRTSKTAMIIQKDSLSNENVLDKKVQSTNESARVSPNVVVTVPIVEPIEEKKDIPIVTTEVKEEKREKPLVIPIEEYQKKQKEKATVEKIYKDVKEEVQTKNQQEELVYTEITPNKEEAKEELRKATEELIKQEAMRQQENIDLTKFEEEQEENAIISMDELMKKSKDLYIQNEAVQYQDEGNEPISLEDLEKRMSQIKKDAASLEVEIPTNNEIIQEVVPTIEEQPKVKLDDFHSISIKDAYKEDHVFKSSPIISPIFGIEPENAQSKMELENTANYEKLDDEIRKTNEFLATLKELQKKLD